jgi:hypothetical protein
MYKDYKGLEVDFVQIYEWSHEGKELLTVGNNGSVSRWTPLHDKSQVFILRKDVKGVQPARASYDSNPYVFDSKATNENKWVWNAEVPFERTIYNPLDGGVLLRYKQDVLLSSKKPVQEYRSDGCSGPTLEPWKTYFLQACLAHDTNYDAPFDVAGFPSYDDTKVSLGHEIADYLFLKDMLLLKEKTSDKVSKEIIATAAYSWYNAVESGGTYRGSAVSKEGILATGGVIAVKNNGLFTMGLRVKWIIQGAERSEEILNYGGRAAVIPLSVDATNIEVECWAVLGSPIFKKKFDKAGMYTFTVTGGSLNPAFQENVLRVTGNTTER